MTITEQVEALKIELEEKISFFSDNRLRRFENKIIMDGSGQRIYTKIDHLANAIFSMLMLDSVLYSDSLFQARSINGDIELLRREDLNLKLIGAELYHYDEPSSNELFILGVSTSEE